MEIIPAPGRVKEDRAQRWEADKAALVRWDGWNYEYLAQSFSSPEVALAYLSDRPDLFSWEGPLPDAQRREVAAWLRKKMDWLSELADRLDLYDDAPEEPPVKQTINIHGKASVGQLGLSITNLQNRIAGVDNAGQPEIARALGNLTQAIVDELSLADGRRAELLENLEDLTEQASAPTEQRKQGRIRAAVDAIAGAATVGTQLHEAWTAWGPTIQQLLPR